MKKISNILIIVILFVSCTTTTPKKYLNNVVVSSNIYTKDTIMLKKEVLAFYNLKNKIYAKSPNYQRKILDIRIDTLIYGKDNKFVALILIDDYNKYIHMSDSIARHISFAGECVIGKKENNLLYLSNILVLKTFSSKKRELARKGLRNNYFRNISNKRGIYNINDVRFWNSKVWEDNLVERIKKFYLKQQVR